MELRLARVGSVVVLLYREPSGVWQVVEVIGWPGLAATLQVGMVAFSDWLGASGVSAFVHNNTAVSGNEDLSAEFDYIRFSTPVVPPELVGQDLTAVPHTDLLGFLGFDSEPVDVVPPSSPTILVLSNITESSVDLSWEASVDLTSPPVTYNPIQDGVEVQNGLAATNTTVSGLMPDTPYNFSVSATDAVGNLSSASAAIDVSTLPPSNLDPLSDLTDEFDDNATLVNWTRLYQTENWSADPLTLYDINSSNASALTMAPSASTWWEDRIGAFSYKEVIGDFVVSTNVRVTSNAAALYSLAGLMARVPQTPGYDSQTDFTTGQQNYYNFLLGYTTQGPEMLYNHTQQSSSNNPSFPVGGYEVQIRIARVGDVMISLRAEPDGNWQVNEAISWPGLADTLQVGVVAFSDWNGASSVSAFNQNNTAVSASEDLTAAFDYVRFSTPQLPAELEDQDLTTVDNTALLSFLGFDDEPDAPGETQAQLLPWSDPATWEGGGPAAGDNVIIPADNSILLDQSPPNLGGLVINGTLIFGNQDIELNADWIVINGALQIGSEAEPFGHQATITLTGDDPTENIMGMGTLTRGIMVMDGSLKLHGNPPIPAWTKINQHANVGDTYLTLSEPVVWSINDEIVLAPTDYYGVSESETYQITELGEGGITVNYPVGSFRWGLMQYATDTGMSLSPAESVIPPADPEDGATPLQLDERAEIGNLTRNIVIQGANDDLWQNEGFGAHVMVMALEAEVHVDGVQFRRVGQAGRLARYPFHWHELSYDENGNDLGDAAGQYIRNSSIHGSQNRCITIHGTNGVQVQNNICYDVLGHAIYFEDAVERRNTVEDNLVLRVRNPSAENALKLHDTSNQQPGHPGGASGIWVSNPDNVVRNNTLADAQGFGMWMAFPMTPVGSSAHVPTLPARLQFGDFDGNTMHSNQRRGVMFDESEIDNVGNLAALQYFSTSDGQDIGPPFDNIQRFSISGWTLWKNGEGNFWNRVFWPTYSEFVSADSSGKFFAGSGSGGIITQSLIVGSSLNDFSARPFPWIGPSTALATYHSTFDMRENIIVNFPFVDGQTSGVFASDDYYIRPVEKGHIRNDNNLMINSHPGYRSNAAVDEDLAFNFANGATYYVFSGALWDPHGNWGPPENWSVYDVPFLTHNANCEAIEPVSQNAASCEGQYYGVNDFILDQANHPEQDFMAIHVTRFDDNNPDLVVDYWHVDGAQTDWPLGHMRHFAARQNGIYLLDFPNSATPSDVSVDISNMHNASDTFVLGIRFAGAEEAQVYSTTYTYPGYFNDNAATAPSWPSKHDYTEMANRQAVIDSTGESYWQDHDNDIVWIKVTVGDLVQFVPPPEGDETEFSDEILYNEFHLRIW